MFRTNGGLLGARRLPGAGIAPGVWSLAEQVTARRAGIWPGNDPFFGNVSLLLHMDGSNNSTTFTDSSSNGLTVTANGDAKISTVQSKFGGSSCLLDGNSDWLSVSSNAAMSLGSGDFTVETFLYLNAVSANQSIIDTIAIGGSGARNTGFIWFITTGNKLTLFSGGAFRGESVASLSSGQWYHLALVRSSGVFSYFIDGAKDATTFTLTTNFTDSQAQIGRAGDTTYWLNGYLDEFRITKAARYTANFTTPAAAFSNS